AHKPAQLLFARLEFPEIEKMKLFLTVALSLTMIALIAHAQSYQYPPPPPNYPPPAYAPPPSPSATQYMPPPPQYAPPAPQQAVTPPMRPMQQPYQAQQQAPSTPALQAQQQGNITFVSGGAGDEDRDALHQVENQYNLRLMFAARNGDFLANIGVTLSDARGKAVLDTVAEGPIFYAHVPPGRYRVTVSNQGHAQSRDITIGNGPVRQDFYWAAAS
ncbi:MAG TPA: hypothetical protein VHX19_09915, partial [Stellaceae bacterium]|nr:hypothetical protein [Stellaceae bacterium]